ncbi:MAG: DUF1634 domain-containing protein [Thermoplasmata archaeon]|nr:DUF1634 domain-containing protein [Thermoplasmata archaeon]
MSVPSDPSARLTRRVALTLRWGVGAAGGLMIAGLAVQIAHGPGSLLEHANGLSAGTLRASLLPPSAIGLVLLGVIVLAATPLVRVVLSFEYFVSMGDRAFSALTLFVLAVLLSSVAVGVFA